MEGRGGGGGGGDLTTGEGVCPACCLPFDSGRKRKLIDSCGHGRCYSCMFSNEVCPLCVISGYTFPPASIITTTSMSETSLSASDLPETRSAVSVRSFRRSASSDNDSTEAINDVIIPEPTASPKVTVSEMHLQTKTPPPPPPTPNLPRYIQPILPPNVSPSLYLSHLHPDSASPTNDQNRHSDPLPPPRTPQPPPPPPPRPPPRDSDQRSDDIPNPNHDPVLRHADKDEQYDSKAQKFKSEHLYLESVRQEFGERPRRKCSSDGTGTEKDGEISNDGKSKLGERQIHSSKSLRQSFSGEALRQAYSGREAKKNTEKTRQSRHNENLRNENRPENFGQNDNRDKSGPRYISENLRQKSETHDPAYRYENAQEKFNGNYSHENFQRNSHRNRDGRRNSNEIRGEDVNEKFRESYSSENIGQQIDSSDSALGSPDFNTTASTCGTTTTLNTTTTGEKDSLEGSDDDNSPPPPSPDVAQHDLVRRLSLLLGDRPSSVTPTPTPMERSHGGNTPTPTQPPPPSPASAHRAHHHHHHHHQNQPPPPPVPSERHGGGKMTTMTTGTVVATTSTTSSLSSNEDEDEEDEDEDITLERGLSDASPLSSLTVSSGSEQNRMGRPPRVDREYPDEESQGMSSDSLVSLMSLSTTHSLSQHPGPTQRSHSFVVTHSPNRPLELQLTPLPFEIPHPEGPPLFVGRHWVFQEMDLALNGDPASQSAGIVLLGGIGSGKTAILEQLITHSCFHDSTTLTSPSTTTTPTTITNPPTLGEPQRNSKDFTPSPTSGVFRNTASFEKSNHLAPPHLTVKNLREDGGTGRNSPALSSDSSHSSYKTAIYSEKGDHSPSHRLSGKGGGTGGTATPRSDCSRGGSFGASDKISNLRPKHAKNQQESLDAERSSCTSLYGTDVYNEKQKVTTAKIGGSVSPTTFVHPAVESVRWEGGCVQGGGGEEVERLGSQVVAYHLCQADINVTCLVPDFVHSVASYLAMAPRLRAYRDLLAQEPQLQQLLSPRGCIQNPSASFVKGVLEPLKTLESCGKIPPETALILVDSLNEAEFHRADHGDTIASFLARHVALFPPWLKLVVACQSVVQEIVRPLPFQHIVLDKPEDEGIKVVGGDVYHYIHYRLLNSIPLRSNVCPYGKFDAAAQQKFCTHLQTLSKGCFLHVKLVLDLIEHGHLVVKGSNYKILPVNLSEVFLLHFNLKFSSVRAFERVANILAVCLAALYPLSLRTIFMTVNSGYTSRFVAWEDFCSRMTMLSGLLHQRRDGCFMFFHPAFREWLIRRDDSDATKFLCGLRLGHALVAFRLSRVDAPLSPEKTVELGHHILKAHIYKGTRHPGGVFSSRELQGWWVCLGSYCLSRALVTPRNVFCPNIKVSRLLLSAGANPDARTDYLYNSPIICVAAKQGFADLVSLLLEFGADPDCTSELLGIPALCYAAACGHSDVVRLLCQHGARPSLPDKLGQTAAVHAALRGQLESLALILQLEWSPRQGEPSRNDVTLQSLVAAAGAGHRQIVEYLHLVTRGEALDLVDSLFGETATTAACIQGQSDVLQYLLEEGADTTAPNSKTLSPLLCAAMFGERQIAESLLAAGADPEQTDKFGRTALIVAASEGHFEVLDMMLSKGVQLERTDQEGLTALCWACLKGHVTSVHALCACGADVNHSDRRGRVPLHLAAYHGDVQLVQYLLERGAQLERVDTHGLRPLERAINRDNLTVVDAFLRHGAKLGQATWTVAAGKPEVMLLLLNQVLDDGNRLYKKNRIKEAAQCYRHALKRFPRERDRERRRKNVLVECLSGEEKKAYRDLKFHLLLNLSRCKRKLQDYTAAVDLATRAMTLKPRCFQAYYARARAYRAADHLSSAHADLMHALRLAPNNPEVRRLLCRLQEESTPRSSRHFHESDRPYGERDRRYEDDEDEDFVEGGCGSRMCLDETNL